MSTCPTWCVVNHAERFAFDLDAGMTLCQSAPMLVELDATEYRPARLARVRVGQARDLGGTPDPVSVTVGGDLGEMTAGDARRLAAALIYAAEMAGVEHLAVTR